MNSIASPDDIEYIAALIQRLDEEIEGVSLEESREFTKALILVTSGIVPGKIYSSQVPYFEEAFRDYVENFKALYPHYFDNIHPAFMWVSGVVAMEEMSYN